MPRFFSPTPLVSGDLLELPAGAARHVQVLRLQPGDAITLFNNGPGWDGPSPGGEFEATVTRMGRSDVQVQVGAHIAIEREPTQRVVLAAGMPANDRMDWLIEKATEMGVWAVQPLMCERSVLRLSGERAEKKVAHWQSVAVSASEQCGGNRVPAVLPVASLGTWLAAIDTHAPAPAQRLLLSLDADARPLGQRVPAQAISCFLSGPEGGLSAAEEAAARAAGFAPVTLGPRVLRAETAALFALASLLAT